jgi:hypothetical protein
VEVRVQYAVTIFENITPVVRIDAEIIWCKMRFTRVRGVRDILTVSKLFLKINRMKNTIDTFFYIQFFYLAYCL